MRWSSRGELMVRCQLWLMRHALAGKSFGIMMKSSSAAIIVTHNDPWWKMDLHSFHPSPSEALQRLIQPSNLVFDNPFTLPRLSLCFSRVTDLCSKETVIYSMMVVIPSNYFNHIHIFMQQSPSVHSWEFPLVLYVLSTNTSCYQIGPEDLVAGSNAQSPSH